MNKKIKYISMTLVLLFIVSACTPTEDNGLQEELEAKDQIIGRLENENKELEERIAELEEGDENGPEASGLIARSLETVELLKSKNIEGLAALVHPTKGLRFSPYGHINLQSDQVFTQDEVADLLNNSDTFTWGSFDGSGEPIDLDFNDYFERFVYDVDFANPHMIGNNTSIGTGNTLNNIEEAYPNGEFTEFYFTGFEAQYEGMDWKTLRLVFEEENDNHYLIGIVHDEWTI